MIRIENTNSGNYVYVIMISISMKGGIVLKTFKMLSFQMEMNGALKNFPLEDGILINQENSHNTWILEAFTPTAERKVFDDLLASEEVFEARVVISFPDNDPALFRLVVSVVKEIGDHVSVLMNGTIIRKQRKNPSELLKTLLDENVPEDELLSRFESALNNRS